MRKLFLLIPAFLLSLAVSAKEIEISSGTTDIISTTIADAGTEDGDVIVLTDNGPYVQANQILFTKSITLRAAEGKLPVVAQHYYSELKNSAQVNIIGIKFDGSLYNSVGANDHCFRCGDATDNKTLYMENCEITSFKSYIFYIKGGNNLKSCTLKDCKFSSSKRFFYVEETTTVNQLALDGCEIYSFSERAIGTNSSALIGSCNIENCYFHNNASNSLYMENTSESNINITNSTFIDNATPASSGVVHAKATSGTISVNHCTFYNCPVSSSSYGTVQFVSPNAVVSNSIFVLPTTTNVRAIHMPDNNTVNNCLTYKYTYDTDGIRDGISKTNCKTGNPYFMNTNPANYDFTIWTTSPAHGTANDGYDLGDYTRWNTDPATHVATINITAEDANSLKAAVDAALPGDEIILAAGTYEESENISLDKEITIKAADGASPIVKPVGEFAISNGVEVTIQGIKFDGSEQSEVSNFIYAADALSNSLTVEGCEFYNIGNRVIYAGSDKKLVCTVDDCYFHNNTKSCIYIENTAALNLTVTNSTFANCSTSSRSTVESKTTSGVVTVDHCTFYNCTVESTDYGMIRFNSSNTTVSNNIFAMPSSTDNLRAIYFPDDENSYEIRHCLVYNLTRDSNTGIRRGTKTNCLFIDPRFDDLANNKYSYDEDSPARAAATDGTDLGDPSWYTDRPIYSTDFTSPYTFVATRAVRNAYCTLDANNHLKTKNTDPIVGDAYSIATWQIQSTRAVAVKATINMASDSQYGHNYKVAILDSEDNQIGELSKAWLDTHEPFDLNGLIYIPAAGVYTIKLSNIASGSSAIVEGITLTADGGNVTNIATDANTSLDVADAWFTSGATRADGTITYSSWNSTDSWIKWNIATSETKFYDVSMRINTTNAHHCTVAIYEDEAAEPIATVQEIYSSSTGDALDIEIGRVNLVGGKNYVVKVTNPVSGSAAKIVSVTFIPVVATSTALPNTLNFSNAVLSEKANITDGMLYFNEPGADKDPRGQWAQWEVTTNHNGLFLFTMGVTSTNQQSYKITIKDNSENELEYFEANPGTGDKTIKHYFNLATGTYFVKVENTYSYSKGHLTSLEVTEPGVVTLDENATDNSTWSEKVGDHNTYDVQIIRSFRGGMNNTFCLPFAVSSSQCKEVFGNDVEIYTLGEATIEDYILNLTINPSSDIHQGTPVLIKPARDIVNPVFTGVEFKKTASEPTTQANADFVGSFVKTPLSASDDLLYVGPENKVFFLSVDYDMPGMRAWFEIHDVPAVLGSPKALRSARIIEKEQITTSILNVETSGDAARKVLYDGQIVIIRGNEMYNMQGQHIQ